MFSLMPKVLLEPDDTPRIIIAVDGFAACGKSTLAKAVAARLGYGYIDSGAMYRAATLFLMQRGIEYTDLAGVAAALPDLHIFFRNTRLGNRTFLNNVDVEEAVRSMAVSDIVSEVSAISSVRRAMVLQQQQMSKQKGVVMDGRDIGTVVFPKAELKIFMTADVNVRVARRQAELAAKGIFLNAEVVQKNLLHRDNIDSTRADSPLRKADDAIIIDNSDLTPAQQMEQVLAYARERIGGF